MTPEMTETGTQTLWGSMAGGLGSQGLVAPGWPSPERLDRNSSEQDSAVHTICLGGGVCSPRTPGST